MRNKLVSLLGIMLIASVVIAVCWKNNQQSLLQPTISKQTKQGGQLIYGSLQEPGTLTPYISNLLSEVEVQSLVFSGLVSMNNKLEWQPDAAEIVPLQSNGGVSWDGLTVTYKLRRGIKWHDGAELTSSDVRYTWQFIMNPRIPVVSRLGYDKIAAIDTPDPYTVIIRFREPYSGYLTLFPAILPQHVLGQQEGDIARAPFNKYPVGSGPFKFKSWQLADAIYLEANDQYFRGRPRLDKIVYKLQPDINIMLTQLKTGAIDIISNIGQAQLEQVKAISDMQVLLTPNTIWEHMDYNLDNPLFADIRVRKAIILALNRQNMAATTLKGTAVVATADQSPSSWAYNPGIVTEIRDVNGAKRLLSEAGWTTGANGILVKDGKRLSFNVATISGQKSREYIKLAIQQQLREVGIEINFTNYAPDNFTETILRRRNFDMAMYAYVVGVDCDNTNLWKSANIPAATNNYEGKNYTGWKNAEIDGLTVAGGRTFDQEQRKQIYFRIQELIAQELPCVPLFFRANIDVVKTHVVNFQPSPMPGGNLWNAWEWGMQEK